MRSPRGPNKSQYWQCSQCGNETVHEVILDPDSDWANQAERFRGFERWRRCTKCFNILRTVEVTAEKLRVFLTELQQLREIKHRHEKLVAALSDRNAAEKRINSIVNPNAEITAYPITAAGALTRAA